MKKVTPSNAPRRTALVASDLRRAAGGAIDVINEPAGADNFVHDEATGLKAIVGRWAEGKF